VAETSVSRPPCFTWSTVAQTSFNLNTTPSLKSYIHTVSPSDDETRWMTETNHSITFFSIFIVTCNIIYRYTTVTINDIFDDPLVYVKKSTTHLSRAKIIWLSQCHYTVTNYSLGNHQTKKKQYNCTRKTFDTRPTEKHMGGYYTYV